MLPFTAEQFLSVFATYNHAIWPAQAGAYLLGCCAIFLLFWKMPHADRIACGILAIMWLWTGIAYHGIFFSTINKAAYLFGASFVVEGGALLYFGVYHNHLRFGRPFRPAAWVGAAFVIYAAVLYPLIGLSTGHSYPELPMFGVTPCPVTIFTFGMFLLTASPVSRWLMIVPFIWSLVGGSAAVLLQVPQDWLLLISGFIAVPIIHIQDRATRLTAPLAT